MYVVVYAFTCKITYYMRKGVIGLNKNISIILASLWEMLGKLIMFNGGW